ncbi:MAG: SET domain-containing protein-lysine N-methyltransferase [Deltaproteobacteria bacterium]|nr:SET domain-containing protein-lysine N-methyltransferase [Deltaproteobacteria bacterium]MCW5805435.1 SET domain-containing protein-lysine N-methyltransferase [Deltaproteobacteria bacterium]
MIHPETALRWVDDTIGYGVFATRPIPRGTIVWVRDPLDQPYTQEMAAQLPPLSREMLSRYSYVNRDGEMLLCWDHGRYVNHSCAASCITAGWEFEIAVRDIAVGEELTDEYGTFSIDESFRCACGTAACRGMIHPDDVFRYGDAWDRTFREVFLEATPRVEQPLWSLVVEREEVELALAGKLTPPSCRVHVRPDYVARWRDRAPAMQVPQQAAM